MSTPYPCRFVQLMRRILSLQILPYPQETNLLLYCVQPLIRLERFSGLFEDRRLGVLEVFGWAVLIWFRPLMLLADMSGVLCNEAQCLFHSSLISQKLHSFKISKFDSIMLLSVHFKYRKLIIFGKLKSNIRLVTFWCIHAAAPLFLQWLVLIKFEFGYKINLKMVC